MENFNIKQVKGEWLFSVSGNCDEALTVAFQDSICRLDENNKTDRAIAGFIEDFCNFKMNTQERSGCFEFEEVDYGFDRITAYLESLGYKVLQSDRADSAMWVNRGDGKNFGILSMKMKCLHLFFGSLARQGLRSKILPTNVEGWDGWTEDERRDMKQTIYKSANPYIQYNGMAFVVSQPIQYAIRIEDPRGLGPKMIAAAQKDRWPPSVLNLLRVIYQTGGRYADIAPITALDWWHGSKFGLAVETPLKRSRGERQGFGVFDEETRQHLIEAFDSDPERPDFSKLETLVTEDRFEELEQYFLFPSAMMVPFAYRNFTKCYVCPTMVKHNVEIVSSCGTRRSIASLHRLRAASIQHGIEVGFEQADTDADRLAIIDLVRRDHHIKSQNAFDRYLGNIFKDLGIDVKIARINARRAAVQTTKVLRSTRGNNDQRSKAAEQMSEFA